MDTVNIVDKIQKLLALAESPNENEAFLALQKANALLKDYNLTLNDLHKYDFKIKESILKLEQYKSYEIVLFNTIAEWNFCQCLMTTDTQKVKHLHFIGREHNVITTFEFINYIVEKIQTLVRMQNKMNKYSIELYKLGLFVSLTNKIKQEIQQNKNNTNEKALVVKNNAEILDYIKAKYNKNMTTEKLNTADALKHAKEMQAYIQGYKDGSHISLYQQIHNKNV